VHIGVSLQRQKRFSDTAREVRALESLGVDVVHVAEAYGFDAVSQLGYLAAITSRVRLAAGILPIYSRTPALIAMTAAGLDDVSAGRFILGLGASGPRVIEGFHGVRFDAPIERTREIVDICRHVWTREKLVHSGIHYQAPLTVERGGSGLGRPLKLLDAPVRARIPVMLAAIGPKNVELAAELADIWEPIWFSPMHADQVWGGALAAGRRRRRTGLDQLQIVTNVPVAVGKNAERLREQIRPMAALYIGGMGARGKNFYTALARRYGFNVEADRVQDLYLSGEKAAAAAAVPADFLEATTLMGSRQYIAERLDAFKAAGVTGINAIPVGDTESKRLASLEALLELGH
jgi:F420-dependent oxidoreductase-like protein